MNELKISVVIAIYNVGQYLEKCLNSVAGQTYTNLEIICVDDGSTDNSGQICDDFVERDSRIVVIHKANGGECSARNVGIDRCTGDYISLIDGDDWLETDMYETLVDNITADDIDISACGYFEDEGNMSKPIANLLPAPEKPMDVRGFLPYIYIRDQYRGVASYLPTRIIRRGIIVDHHIRFDDSMRVSYDQIFAAQCYMKARNIVYTSKHLYHYVQRKGSAMHDADRRLDGLGSCVAFQKIIDLYEKCLVDESVVDYVKRFYVYHASKLLKLAFEYRAIDKIEPLKANIYKYFNVYCRTNQEYPERIQEMRQLLEREV